MLAARADCADEPMYVCVKVMLMERQRIEFVLDLVRHVIALHIALQI